MSRIGRTPIKLGSDVSVEIKGRKVTVSGPNGTLDYTVPEPAAVKQEDGELLVECDNAAPRLRALHGTVRSLLSNMVIGVTQGYRRELEIQGVGYRGTCNNNTVTLNLGLSHPVEYQPPEGVEISMPDNTHIVVQGIDKQRVGQAAATIRRFRPPNAYKGKGIRYAGEQITLKEGKTVG